MSKKRKKKQFPPIVRLRYAPVDRDVYCELCCEPIKVGAPMAWWPVRRWSGRTAVERQTAYCPTCHSTNARAKRPLLGDCNRNESGKRADAEEADEEGGGGGKRQPPDPAAKAEP
jgi:hypothetical protein